MVLFALYIVIQSRSFLFPPSLNLFSGEMIRVQKGEEVVIKGETDRFSRAYLNGAEIPLDKEGRFSQSVIMPREVSTFEIMARNRFGKETKKTLTASRIP
ncbi:MAG: hypothetical protein HY001_00625 [Candidatus Portnoybacteria bacterium]|nr:hypothetical protein [Candidatus Portnoybacteria bacterium]